MSPPSKKTSSAADAAEKQIPVSNDTPEQIIPDAPLNEKIMRDIVDLISDKFGLKKDEVTPTASFINDLGADSLDTVMMVMAIEEIFEISIPDKLAEMTATATDLHNLVVFIKEHPEEAARYKQGEDEEEYTNADGDVSEPEQTWSVADLGVLDEDEDDLDEDDKDEDVEEDFDDVDENKTAVVNMIKDSIQDMQSCIDNGNSLIGEIYREKALLISIFPSHRQRNLGFHIDLLKHLALKNKLNDYKIYKVRFADDSGCIIIESDAEIIQSGAFGRIYYLLEAEEYVDQQFGGDWESINAESTLGDTPEGSNAVNLESAMGSSGQILERIHESETSVNKIC